MSLLKGRACGEEETDSSRDDRAERLSRPSDFLDGLQVLNGESDGSVLFESSLVLVFVILILGSLIKDGGIEWDYLLRVVFILSWSRDVRPVRVEQLPMEDASERVVDDGGAAKASLKVRDGSPRNANCEA